MDDQRAIKVNRLSVNGVKRTNPDIISKIIKSLFNVKNLDELFNESITMRDKLLKFGAFKDVLVSIDKDDMLNYQVAFDVVETGRVGCGVHTLVGNNEASLNSSLKLSNIWCRGETFTFNASYNTQKFLGFTSSLLKPFYFGKSSKSELSFNLFNNSMDFHWTDLLKLERGFSLCLQNLLTRHLTYTMAWEVGWRTALGKHDFTPFTIREQFGHSLKSSLKHILSYDTRDNPFLPNAGLLLKMQQEFAGLGGDTAFTKTHLDIHQNVPLNDPFKSVLQLTFSSGFIVPNTLFQVGRDLKARAAPTVHMIDKFYLGGPLTFRGFSYGQLGSKVEGYSTGVDFYWLFGLHLYNPLPYIGSKNAFFSKFVRTHLFCNFGAYDSVGLPNFFATGPEQILSEGAAVDIDRPLNSNIFDELYNKIRLSLGCGLVLNFGNMARCEFNYCFYTYGQKGDKISSGLQAGVGIDFN